MKIGVVGCGALGSYYGAKLRAAGHDVHFLLRSDYDVVRAEGVRIQSPDGDLHVRPVPAKDPMTIGPCDLVLIGLKTTANSEFPRLVPPLIGADTPIMTLQNGLGNEERLAELFGGARVLGGLCFVCLNRIAPGVIQHSAHGDVLLGEHEGPPQTRTARFAEMFQKAGVRCRVTDHLEKTHWEKLVWNIPFNGLGVASAAGYDAVMAGRAADSNARGPCLTTDQLLADPRWTSLVSDLMNEVITGAASQGIEIQRGVVDDWIARTRRMGAYKASTLVDFERGQPLELHSLFLEPLRRARAAGAVAPRLEALCQVLAELNPANGPRTG